MCSDSGTFSVAIFGLRLVFSRRHRLAAKHLLEQRFNQVCTSIPTRPKPTAVFANLLTSWIAGIFEVDQIVVRLSTLATRIHLSPPLSSNSVQA